MNNPDFEIANTGSHSDKTKLNPLNEDIYTDRLRLKPIGADSAEDLWRLFQDDDIAKWYGGKWTMEKAEVEAAKMGEAWNKPGGVHKWIAYDKSTNEIIGRGGLSIVHMEGKDEVEIGWAVRQKFQGQGYASEIGRAGLDLAFSELDTDHVIAFTEPHNERSRDVMERLDFTYVKEMDHEGERFVLYRLTKENYGKITSNSQN
jgi:RimJ/RimL family protein N-acetyltransferase